MTQNLFEQADAQIKPNNQGTNQSTNLFEAAMPEQAQPVNPTEENPLVGGIQQNVKSLAKGLESAGRDFARAIPQGFAELAGSPGVAMQLQNEQRIKSGEQLKKMALENGNQEIADFIDSQLQKTDYVAEFGKKISKIPSITEKALDKVLPAGKQTKVEQIWGDKGWREGLKAAGKDPLSALGGVSRVAIQSIPTMAAAAMTKGASLIPQYISQQNNDYQKYFESEAKEKGFKDPKEIDNYVSTMLTKRNAATKATIYGTASGVSESILGNIPGLNRVLKARPQSIKMILKNPPKYLAHIGKKILTEGLREGGEEALQEGFQSGLGYVAQQDVADKPIDPKTLFDTIASGALIGGASGGLMGSGFGGFGAHKDVKAYENVKSLPDGQKLLALNAYKNELESEKSVLTEETQQLTSTRPAFRKEVSAKIITDNLKRLDEIAVELNAVAPEIQKYVDSINQEIEAQDVIDLQQQEAAGAEIQTDEQGNVQQVKTPFQKEIEEKTQAIKNLKIAADITASKLKVETSSKKKVLDSVVLVDEQLAVNPTPELMQKRQELIGKLQILNDNIGILEGRAAAHKNNIGVLEKNISDRAMEEISAEQTRIDMENKDAQEEMNQVWERFYKPYLNEMDADDLMKISQDLYEEYGDIPEVDFSKINNDVQTAIAQQEEIAAKTADESLFENLPEIPDEVDGLYDVKNQYQTIQSQAKSQDTKDLMQEAIDEIDYRIFAKENPEAEKAAQQLELEQQLAKNQKSIRVLKAKTPATRIEQAQVAQIMANLQEENKAIKEQLGYGQKRAKQKTVSEKRTIKTMADEALTILQAIYDYETPAEARKAVKNGKLKDVDIDSGILGNRIKFKNLQNSQILGQLGFKPEDIESGVVKNSDISPALEEFIKQFDKKQNYDKTLGEVLTQEEQEIEQAKPKEETQNAYDHKQFRKDLLEKFKVSKEEADTVIALLKARAETVGETLDEYIAKRIAGVEKSTPEETADREGVYLQSAPPVDSAAFKNWFGGSKVVDEDGKPMIVYHGTTHDFEIFETELFGNIENHLGSGHYFTDSKIDVEQNYLSEGKDLTNKIEREADNLANYSAEELSNELNISLDEAQELEGDYKALNPYARKKVAGQTEKVIGAYLKIENPLILSPDEEGTRLDYEVEYDEETEEYGEPSGKVAEVIEALRDESYNYNDINIDGLISDIYEKFDLYESSQINTQELFDFIKENENATYASNDNGDLSVSQYMQDVFRSVGFDGIIMDTVHANKKWNMDVPYGAKHYIVFDSKQIKSVDNKGTFDPNNPNIFMQFAGTKSKTADKMKYREAMSRLESGENAEKIRKETGWFRGVDGKMRYEIDDSQAEINKKEFNKKYDKKTNTVETTLGKILVHPTLYNAYPNIKNYPIKINMDNKTGGKFSGTIRKFFGNEIINGDIEIYAKNTSEIKSKIMHEIQHYIQLRENFARGGNPSVKSIAPDIFNKLDYINQVIYRLKKTKNTDNQLSELRETKKHLTEILRNIKKNPEVAYNKYLSLAGEVESRLTEYRMNYDEELRKQIPPFFEMDVAPENQTVVFSDGSEAQFDLQASEARQIQQEINKIVAQAKKTSSDASLTEDELRHKETAYDILAYGLKRDKNSLKRILENDSKKNQKAAEKIQKDIRNINDPYSSGDGMKPEWSEFFTDPGVSFDNQETGADEKLADAAYRTILDKQYIKQSEEDLSLKNLDNQYEYILNAYKEADNKDIPNAAFVNWLENVKSDRADFDAQEYYADKFGQDRKLLDKFGQTAHIKGAVEFLDDGRAIITAFEKPNVSTIVHELFHIFERDLSTEERGKAEKWLGVKDGNWTREHHEQFARAGERYLREGKTPIAALKEVFAKFKKWLSDIYKVIKGSEIDVKMTKDVRKTFDNMFNPPVAQIRETLKASILDLQSTEVNGKPYKELIDDFVAQGDVKATIAKRGSREVIELATENAPGTKLRLEDESAKEYVKAIADGEKIPDINEVLNAVNTAEKFGAVQRFSFEPQATPEGQYLLKNLSKNHQELVKDISTAMQNAGSISLEYQAEKPTLIRKDDGTAEYIKNIYPLSFKTSKNGDLLVTLYRENIIRDENGNFVVKANEKGETFDIRTYRIDRFDENIKARQIKNFIAPKTKYTSSYRLYLANEFKSELNKRGITLDFSKNSDTIYKEVEKIKQILKENTDLWNKMCRV